MKNNLRPLTLPLLMLVAFNLLPNLYLKPLWSTALALIFIGYRFFIEITGAPMLPRWILWLAGGAVGTAIWQYYHSIFGDEAAGTLLTLLTCLKTYELRWKRDYFFNALLCFLVLMSYLLIDQSLLLTLFLGIDVILIISYLHALEAEAWSWTVAKGYLRRSMSLAFRAGPLLVVCFVLFPRFSTGFGTGEQNVAKTGVTDQLRPGSVASLIQSDELIFRATFLKGDVPPTRSLYWRGAVLNKSNGLNWSREKIQSKEPPPFSSANFPDIEVFLEPGSERFLFSLENTRTISIPSDLLRTRINTREGKTFELDQPLQNRERYLLENTERGFVSDIRNMDKFLQTEDRPSAEMETLYKKLGNPQASQVVSNLLKYFRENGFTYTLQAPRADSLDDFIFKNKTGFCEHFAGSMATMLRHMNVPARVIVGFQGGSPSFLENYLSVRARDAHAWVEYFESQSGRWRRIDPTAQVAPTRMAYGGIAGSGERNLLLRFQAMVDEIEANWIGFLLRFDLAKQKELLAKFGMEETLFRALPVFLILSIVLLLAIIYFFQSQSKIPLAKEDRLYRELVAILAKKNVQKAASDGPLSLMERVRLHRPDLINVVEPILEKLILARFAGEALSAIDDQQLHNGLGQLKRMSAVAAPQ